MASTILSVVTFESSYVTRASFFSGSVFTSWTPSSFFSAIRVATAQEPQVQPLTSKAAVLVAARGGHATTSAPPPTPSAARTRGPKQQIEAAIAEVTAPALRNFALTAPSMSSRPLEDRLEGLPKPTDCFIAPAGSGARDDAGLEVRLHQPNENAVQSRPNSGCLNEQRVAVVTSGEHPTDCADMS